MPYLNLSDIQHIRGITQGDRMKECSVARSICNTYLSVLLEMAEEFLKARAVASYKGEKIRYSLISGPDGCGIAGTDGFSFMIGDKETCLDLLRRLNQNL